MDADYPSMKKSQKRAECLFGEESGNCLEEEPRCPHQGQGPSEELKACPRIWRLDKKEL